MANSNAPFGLRWLGSFDAGVAAGHINQYIIPSSDNANYFIGDPVKSTGTGSGKYPTVALATPGDAIRGVIVAFKANPDNLNIIYGSASTTRTVWVVDFPYALFLIQANSTVAVTDYGANADLAAAPSGSTVTGISGYMLDTATITASSAQLRIIAPIDQENNEVGLYTRLKVLINEHELKSTTGVHS